MNGSTIYQPLYGESWALVVGINNYKSAPPLGYATQDAEALADVLASQFAFPSGNITLLIDGDATRERILSSFLDFTNDHISADDRIVIFFAGHGCTRTGRRGEVGFLVPVGGVADDVSTLVRWDDLTRSAELIRAKHLLFIMDACYGGLAIQRNVPPGSARFLKDMLQRYSRQVLTAGKANETVADSGGPRVGHSIFTGHLLDALDGKAADPSAIISANAIMAYVYDHVSKDPHSRQSPHFGFIDGDGDFIFNPPDLTQRSNDDQEDKDVLVQVPAIAEQTTELSEMQSLIDRTKDFLSESRSRIRLDDLVSSEVRAALYQMREEEFPLQTTSVTPEGFAQRLRKYELSLSRLTAMTILLARWGTGADRPLIERVISRLADNIELRSGNTVWLGLRWYPIMLLMYSGGIAALSAENYSGFIALLTTTVRRHVTGDRPHAAVISTVDGMLEVERTEIFKRLPGYERYYTPRSEYLFKCVQPQLEDLLFLGNSFEDLFDRFEILYALAYADIDNRKSGDVWGPPGRFRWKGRHSLSASPYDELCDEAKRAGAAWPPLKGGLFGGSIDRFNEIAVPYGEKFKKWPSF